MKTQIVQSASPLKNVQAFITKMREVKINGYAVFDMVISYFAAYILSFPLAPYITRKRLFYLVIPVSIITHTIFSVHTPLTDQFWNPDGFYFIKIVAVYMLLKGMNYNPLGKISELYSK